MDEILYSSNWLIKIWYIWLNSFIWLNAKWKKWKRLKIEKSQNKKEKRFIFKTLKAEIF